MLGSKANGLNYALIFESSRAGAKPAVAGGERLQCQARAVPGVRGTCPSGVQ